MLKLSTIEELKQRNIITLVTCDKSEKETDSNVVKDSTDNQYKKIAQTQEEIIIELLHANNKLLFRISTTLITLVIMFVFIFLYQNLN